MNYNRITAEQEKRALDIGRLTKQTVNGLFLSVSILFTGVGSLAIYNSITQWKQSLNDFSVATTQVAKNKAIQQNSEAENAIVIAFTISAMAMLTSYAQKPYSEIFAWLAMHFYLDKIANKNR